MKQYTSLYFVGAGGIGMSALVRYFLAKGYKVAGYDRTQSPLTTELKTEGLEIVYREAVLWEEHRRSGEVKGRL